MAVEQNALQRALWKLHLRRLPLSTWTNWGKLPSWYISLQCWIFGHDVIQAREITRRGGLAYSRGFRECLWCMHFQTWDERPVDE